MTYILYLKNIKYQNLMCYKKKNETRQQEKWEHTDLHEKL